jgi:Lon protease-like protein
VGVLPMFPLGTVLFPGALLPLHVFEPRYREMVRDCVAGEPEFGVVLIERGSEVGGGDQRTTVGTVARIVQLAETPDGRYALVAAGTRRVRVLSWLPDDPYPLAEVEDWPDDAHDEADDEELHGLVDAALVRLRRVLALASETGDQVPPATSELSVEPVLASFHAAALAPIGPADSQRLLQAPGTRERFLLLDELLDDAEAALLFRLGAGQEPFADGAG